MRWENAATTIAAGRVHVEPKWITPQETQAATADARTLLRTRATAATVGGTLNVDASVRLTTTVDLLDDNVWKDGMPHSLRALIRRFDSLRAQLAHATARPLIDAAELQLLHYERGGFYRRHVDDGVGTIDRPVRRSISFLCYLTPSDWAPADGGYLRAYLGNGSTVDIPPAAGSLVLFDSTAVPHEVLPTHRDRIACVGWFMCARDSVT